MRSLLADLGLSSLASLFEEEALTPALLLSMGDRLLESLSELDIEPLASKAIQAALRGLEGGDDGGSDDDSLMLEDNAGDGDSSDGLMLEDNGSDGELRSLDGDGGSDDGDSDILVLEDNAAADDDHDDDGLTLQDNAGDGDTLHHGEPWIPLDSWADAEAEIVASGAGPAPPAGHAPLWRGRWSTAATIAYALRRLPAAQLPPRAGGWRVWLVGAREALEGQQCRCGHLAEVLAALCPQVPSWELVLIGPEMESWSERRVDANGAPLLVRGCCGTLHGLLARGGALAVAERPSLLVLLNSGIGTLSWPIVEPWLPTIAEMLTLDVPMLLTCFHDGESEGEQSVFVRGFGAHVLLPPADNPLGHVCPTDCVRRADAAAEAEAAPLVARMALIAEESLQRRAAASDDAAAAATGPSGVLAAYARLNDVKGLETPSRRFCWLRGSGLGAPQLRGECVTETRRRLRELASCWAVAKLPAWLAGLRPPADGGEGGDGGGDGGDGGEGGGGGGGGGRARLDGQAMDAMLIAEAVSEVAIAVRAIELGARPLLHDRAKAAAALGYDASADPAAVGEEGREAAAGGGAEAGGGEEGPSYAGVAAEVRLGRACRVALSRLSAAEAALAALQRLPAEDEAPLPTPVAHTVVFTGAFVHARAEPAASSASLGQIERGATFEADARRGAWVRVGRAEARYAGAWVLTRHPMYGAMLGPVAIQSQ